MNSNLNLEKEVDSNKLFDVGFVNRLTELPITDREKEVLVHIAQGKTNKQISEELTLSTSTVRNHISNIFTKLKISNRSQATAIAIYSGLLALSGLDNKNIVSDCPKNF